MSADLLTIRLQATDLYLDWGFAPFSVWPTNEAGDICACGKPHLDGKNIGKHPIPPDGFKSATRDRHRAHTMMSAAVKPNLGVVLPEGCFGWDLDGDDAVRIDALQKELGALPETFGHQTPHGAHAVYRWPDGLERPRGQILGVVTRWGGADANGYLLGASSRIGDKVYKLRRDKRGQPFPIVELPARWVEAALKAKVVEDERASAGYVLPDRIDSNHRYFAIRDYVAHLWGKRIRERAEVLASVKGVLAPRFAVALTPAEIEDRFDRCWVEIGKNLPDQDIELVLQPGQGATTEPDAEPVDVFDKNGKLVPALAGAALRAEGHLLHGSDDRLWRWSEGVYLPDAAQWVAARLRQIAGKGYRDNQLREVLSWLNTFMPIEVGVGEIDTINLANGRLRWRKGELLPHSPEMVTSIKLPVAWDPGARCPAIDAFLGDVLDPSLHPLVEEIAGLLLVPEQRYRKAVLLLGGGRNGKSTLLHLLTALLGGEAVSAITLRELQDDKFKAAELFGRLANICGDIDYRQSRSSSLFKAIVGGDAISAERKYGQPFRFYPKARLIFSANQPPASADTSPAWFDRWVVVPMNKRIDEGRADPRLAERLTTPEELRGFLVRAVFGLQRLILQQRFTKVALAEEALAEYRAAIEPVSGFVEEECQVDGSARVSRKELYEAFAKWSEQRGHRPTLTQKEFARRLREQVPGLDDAVFGGRRDWVGVGLALPASAYVSTS